MRRGQYGLLGLVWLLWTLGVGLASAQSVDPSSLKNPCTPVQSTYNGGLRTTCLAGLPGAIGGGGGQTYTDGTHTVAGATQLTVTGGTVGGTSPNATLAVSGGGGSLLSATVTLTSAQIKNWFTTPATLIAAPGAGKFIDIVSITDILDYGTATYADPNGDGGLYFSNSSGFNADGNLLSGMIISGSSAVGKAVLGNNGVQAQSVYANKPLVASGTANPTTGDGTLKITVVYQILTF